MRLIKAKLRDVLLISGWCDKPKIIICGAIPAIARQDQQYFSIFQVC